MIKIEANIEDNKVRVQTEIHIVGTKADAIASFRAVIESLYESDKEIFTLAFNTFVKELNND